MFSYESYKLETYTDVRRNKKINLKKYKSLRGSIHFNVYIYIYIHEMC